MSFLLLISLHPSRLEAREKLKKAKQGVLIKINLDEFNPETGKYDLERTLSETKLSPTRKHHFISPTILELEVDFSAQDLFLKKDVRLGANNTELSQIKKLIDSGYIKSLTTKVSDNYRKNAKITEFETIYGDKIIVKDGKILQADLLGTRYAAFFAHHSSIELENFVNSFVNYHDDPTKLEDEIKPIHPKGHVNAPKSVE